MCFSDLHLCKPVKSILGVLENIPPENVVGAVCDTGINMIGGQRGFEVLSTCDIEERLR